MSKKIFTINLPSNREQLAGVRKVAIRPGHAMRRDTDYRRNPKHKGKGWE